LSHLASTRRSLIVLLCLAGCSAATPEDRAIGRASRVDIYEGLPHANNEEQAFRAEKAGVKPVVELAGFSFYQGPLTLSPTDRTALIAVLRTAETYQTFTGEKKCGGFHPDYAVEWRDGAATRTTLICFECGEVKIAGPNAEHRYDLAPKAREALRQVLTPYRRHRPGLNSPTGKPGRSSSGQNLLDDRSGHIREAEVAA